MTETTKKTTEKKDDKPKPIPTSSIEINDTLYEQINYKNTLGFVYLKNGFATITDKIKNNGLEYVPIRGEEIRKGIVKLPTEAKTLVESDLPELLEEIRTIINDYCDLPDYTLLIAPYYVLGTYIYDRLEEYPYLSFQGDSGTGKTRARDVVGHFCYKPTFINGGISAAAAYRLVEKWGGTLLMDEIDLKYSDESADLIRMLNCGWSKNSPTVKCDSANPNILKFFNAYCPKILTRRKQFQDAATESRCLNTITYQTQREDIRKRSSLSEKFYQAAQEIRNKLITFRLAYYKQFKTPEENPLAVLPIEPRMAQAHQAIAVLLKPFPEAYELFKQELIKVQAEITEQRSNTREGQLVNAYVNLLEEGKDTITPSDLCEQVEGDMTFRTAGKYLKSLGFESKPVKIDGKSKRKISIGEDKLRVLKDRYVPTVTTVTRVTTVTTPWSELVRIKKVDVTHVTHVTNSSKGYVTHVTDVTDVTNVTQTVRHYDEGEGAPWYLVLADVKDEKLIDTAIKNGEVFENEPGRLKVLE